MVKQPDRPGRVRRVLLGLLVISLWMCWASVAWITADTDEDGISDCREWAGLRFGHTNEIWKTDPDNSDTDGDGVIDGEEVSLRGPHPGVKGLLDLRRWCGTPTYAALADPTLSDSDEDGLDDARELSEGSSAFAVDSDDDGLDDPDEREWGSDPNVRDTDGDDVRDGDDIDGGASPLEIDEPLDEESWSREFEEGVVFGDFKEIDSVPQLLGSMTGGASSSVPVVGWITGTIADGRDLTANVIHGDWAAAGASGAGFLPYAGDAAKGAKLLKLFVETHPEKVRAVIKAVAAWEKVPRSVRIKFLGTVDGTSVYQLHELQFTDDDILQYAKRGAQLAKLVITLDRAGTKIVHGIASANVDDAGFPESFEDAEAALRAYATEVDATSDVARDPVYIGGFPGPRFKGGRLIDSCTQCSPRPESGTSILRVAKYGSQQYSSTLRSQIDKDTFLEDEGYVVEWHFFAGRTGCAVDPQLLDALDEAGIPYYVHLPS